MIAYMADTGPGDDPFAKRVDWPGKPTHGHLPENDNHGGKKVVYPDARKLPDGCSRPGRSTSRASPTATAIWRCPGERGRPPVVRRGQSLEYVLSPPRTSQEIYHSLTSCQAPCNRDTGIAYPLADGEVPVRLGSAREASRCRRRPGARDTARRRNLPEGTYTYFCRIHPSMRGAFRVKK